MPQKSNCLYFVYLLECKNGKIYTGITTNIEKRFQEHASGRGAKFTKCNPPSHILAVKICNTRSEACKLEWQIKQFKPQKKRLTASQWPKIKSFCTEKMNVIDKRP